MNRSDFPPKVDIREVAPRDGLQNEKATIPTNVKLELIDRLRQAGHAYIEATSFVSPKAIPQLADGDDIGRKIKAKEELTYAALVPNRKGMERAVDAGFREVAIFTAASETFNQKNINASIAESLDRFKGVFEVARSKEVKVRGYISTCFVCPYEGEISPVKVVEVAEQLFDLGCYELSISDTTGKANPKTVKEVFSQLLKKRKPEEFSGHYHDTFGMAVANVMASMEMGIYKFDSSVGGLGGCPYAPGASGNVATEDLVFLFQGLGISTGLDLNKLIETSRFMESHLDHPIPSKVFQALSNSMENSENLT